MKTHKLYIIKKRSNNKVSFVEFILNSRQFKLMTTGSQPHGARWPRFNCVQMIETMSNGTGTGTVPSRNNVDSVRPWNVFCSRVGPSIPYCE